MAAFWEVTFDPRVEFEKDPATRTDGDVGEGVRGGRVQAEAPAGTGTFEEHKGDQCGWGRVGDGARQGMRWEEQAGDLTVWKTGTRRQRPDCVPKAQRSPGESGPGCTAEMNRAASPPPRP